MAEEKRRFSGDMPLEMYKEIVRQAKRDRRSFNSMIQVLMLRGGLTYKGMQKSENYTYDGKGF